MKEIPLSQGKVAIVDDDDFEKLSSYKWLYNEKKPGHGYAQRGQHVRDGFRKYSKKTLYMHREILGCGEEIDHINGNTLDNRKENLRPSNRLMQTRNRASRNGSTSKFAGVHLHKLTGKWRAQIKIDGKIKSLGLHATQEEAYMARTKFIEENQLDWFRR